MRIRSIFSLIAVSCLSLSLCACTASEVVDTVVEGGQEIVETSEQQTTISDDDFRYVDDSLEKPVFFNDLTVTVNLTQGTEYKIDGTAAVNDGGVITYQWYANNVNSHGGGSPIEGADTPVFSPDSSEPGTTFYYVVATNNHDDKVNKATSNVATVNIIAAGGWTLDETGTGYRYMAADGSYPINMWLNVDGELYNIGVDGFPVGGWVERNGAYYYFNEFGILAPNTTSYDGYQTDEYGRRIG